MFGFASELDGLAAAGDEDAKGLLVGKAGAAVGRAVGILAKMLEKYAAKLGIAGPAASAPAAKTAPVTRTWENFIINIYTRTKTQISKK